MDHLWNTIEILTEIESAPLVAIRTHERQLELSQLSYTLPTFKRKRLEKVVCQVLGRKYDCIARRTKGEIRKVCQDFLVTKVKANIKR